MEDREFFDELYRQWSKTTGAEGTFWIVEKVGFNPDNDYDASWDVIAVSEDDSREHIGTFDEEADADFVAGLHGCLADLVRRLHDAVDEADRADERRDEAEHKLAEEMMLTQELEHRLEGLEH
ncbi:hypothetical protein SEA_ANON_39 [Gordonia phage Anon]|nr:hypothetical protein SEA_ANON_39 [Gordonia phage Anon]